MNQDSWYPFSISLRAQGELVYNEQRYMSWVVVVLLVIPVSSGSATNAIGYLCLRPNPVSAHRSFEIYFLHGIVSLHLFGIR